MSETEQKTLPLGWVETTLGEVFQWGSGGTPKSTVSSYYGGCIPWLVIGDLNDGIVTHSANTITDSGLTNSSAKWVESGSVLVAMYGSIGKLGIAGMRLATNQAIAFTDPHPVVAKFLFYYLMGQREHLAQRGKGATQINISQTVLKAYPFLLAPLSEQYRIVEELEKQFSRLDAGVAALKRVQAGLKRYRASVLQAACEGRLVPTESELARADGRDYEPASELLKRILAERREKWEADQLAKMQSQGKSPKDDKWKLKYKEPTPPDTSELPELPEGWCWASVGGLLHSIGSGSTVVPKDKKTEYPILRSSSVRPRYIDFEDVRYVTDNDSGRSTSFLENGDLLFVRLSGSLDYVANCAMVRNLSGQQLQYPDRLFCAKPVNMFIAAFVEVCFAGPQMRKRIMHEAKSTAGHQRVSTGAITYQTIPFPPVDEQVRIVTEVDYRLSLVDGLESTIEANLKRAERLRQSILKRAFEGKLVPQDPNDEPVGVLLEKIRKECTMKKIKGAKYEV